MPDSLRVSAGNPLAVTVKLLAAADGERGVVSAGNRRSLVDRKRETLRRRGANTVGGREVKLYVPPVPATGVPLRTPVDALKVTPVGNAPDSLKRRVRGSRSPSP